MLYAAHWVIFGFVACALVFWVAMLVWAGRLGLFKKSREGIKYSVFDACPNGAGGKDEHHPSGPGAGKPQNSDH